MDDPGDSGSRTPDGTDDLGPPRILVTDDNPGAREALRSVLLRDGYEIHEAGSGEEALRKAREIRPDLILLDVMMPGMDGNQVVEALREDPELAEVPVIMVTALDDRQSRLASVVSGADEYLTKPLDSAEVRARVRTITRLNRYRRLVNERERVDRLIALSPDGIVLMDRQGRIRMANPEAHRLLGYDADSTSLLGECLWDHVVSESRERVVGELSTERERMSVECRLRRVDGHAFPVQIMAVPFPTDSGVGLQLAVRDVTEQHEQLETIRSLNEELITAYDATLEGWVAALDLRHEETEGHTQRVTAMTVRLARALGLPEEEIAYIRRGALLHDIGKLGVPDSILLKPGPLSDEEWAVMKQHPMNAVRWLSPIAFLEPALEIPRHHHERWDGTGYPDGLAGEDIPLAARIFAMVDVWDALSSDREYRAALSPEEVRTHLEEGRGSHFDPELVPVFLDLLEGAIEERAPGDGDGDAPEVLPVRSEPATEEGRPQARPETEGAPAPAQSAPPGAAIDAVARATSRIVHKFNNILQAVRMPAELSLAEVDADAPVAADLREIVQAADDGAELLRDLVVFARPQALSKEVVELNEFTTDWLASFGDEDVRSRIDLTVSDVPVAVEADAEALRRACTELLENALAASSEGRVRVAVDLREAGVGKPAGAIEFCDDGPGIDEEIRSKIFEPFYSTGGGEGLGLPLALGIVQSHDGSLASSSEPGRGSTFTIEIPTTRPGR